MNKKFNSLIIKINLYLIFMGVLTISLLVYGCRKEKKEEIISTSKILSKNSTDFIARINNLKLKFYDMKLDERLNKNTSQNFKWNPNWDNPIIQIVNDTVSYAFFPIQAQQLSDGRLITAKELDSKTYLIVKNEKEYFKGIFYQPSSIGEPKKLSLLQFSGRLLLSNLITKEGFIIDYDHGMPLKTNLSTMVKLNKTSSVGGLSSTTITNCTTIEYCSFMSDGPCRDGAWYVLYRVSCAAPYNGMNYMCNFNLIDYFSETTCETIHTFEDPPSPPEEGGNSGGEGDTSLPNEQVKTPCSESIKLAQDTKFKELFTNLKNKVTDNKEHGYMFSKDVNGKVVNETTITGLANTGEISFNVPNKIDGYIHSHYTGLLPVFSFTDLEAIAIIYKANKMNDPKTFATGVVTASGTQYLLIIDDLEQFKNFANDITRPGVHDGFELAYKEIFKIDENLSPEINEKGFLNFLAIKNSGLALMKGTGSFDSWERKTLSNNNTVTSNPCK